MTVNTETNFFELAFSEWDIEKPVFSNLLTDCATSIFVPSRYQLRPIEDKGSLSDSLTAARVDLFNRTPGPFPLWLKPILKTIAFAAFVFATPFLSCAGVVGQGGLSLYHLVLWLKGGEKAAHHREKVETHALAFFANFGTLCLSSALFIGSIQLISQSIVAAAITALIGARLLFDPRVVSAFSGSENPGGFYKALFLRNEFGLVPSNNQRLLKSNIVKDQDIEISTKGWSFSYQLKGYFGELHKKQGKQFLDGVKELQRKLPSKRKITLSYPPDAGQVIKFLEECQKDSLLPPEEITSWKQKFTTLGEEMALIRKMIEGNYYIGGAYAYDSFHRRVLVHLTLDFPLPKEEAVAYAPGLLTR